MPRDAIRRDVGRDMVMSQDVRSKVDDGSEAVRRDLRFLVGLGVGRTTSSCGTGVMGGSDLERWWFEA